MTHEQLSQLRVWRDMEPITLSEMKSIRLMNRIDTKYYAHIHHLVPLLEAAQAHYRVQVIDTKPIARYDSLYFDTEELDMYILHHNRHLHRQKIRTRSYLDTNQSFLEFKHKSNKGRTKKVRTLIPADSFWNWQRNIEAVAFAQNESNYPLDRLQPALGTAFDRITLVNHAKTERLTIDLNVTFSNKMTQREASLDAIMIIELKQDGNASSEMKGLLRALRIMPSKISKYCIGTCMTNPNVKRNRFNNKLRSLARMSQIK